MQQFSPLLMGVRPSMPQGQQNFGAPPSLEINKEAERTWMMQQQMQMQAKDEAKPMMAAMEAEQKEERQCTRRRKKEEGVWELSALREEEAARDRWERNRHEEQRRANLERDVIQDQSRPCPAHVRPIPPVLGATPKCNQSRGIDPDRWYMGISQWTTSRHLEGGRSGGGLRLFNNNRARPTFCKAGTRRSRRRNVFMRSWLGLGRWSGRMTRHPEGPSPRRPHPR